MSGKQQQPTPQQQQAGPSQQGAGINTNMNQTEQMVQNLLESYAKRCEARRNDAKAALLAQNPDFELIRRLRPVFREWLEIHAISQVGAKEELLQRCNTAQSYIATIPQGSEHFNEFRNWINVQFDEIKARLQPQQQPAQQRQQQQAAGPSGRTH